MSRRGCARRCAHRCTRGCARHAHRATAAELEDVVLANIKPGDVVMAKGSNGSRMARIVAAARKMSSDPHVAVN